MSIRLDKFLVNMGVCSRNEAKKYCKSGKILVNGKAEKKSDVKINENTDEIVFEGKKLVYEKYSYFMLNKPAGYVSATTDNREKTVIDLINENKKDLFPVGRLDKDTVGLLIITNDGDLSHRLLSPAKHIPKTYFVRVEGRLTDEHVDIFKTGIELKGDGITKPSELKIISSSDVSEAELTIYEGKFHQVKRMMSAVGCKVIYLKRIKMGELLLDDTLPEGHYRKLETSELELLCSGLRGAK